MPAHRCRCLLIFGGVNLLAKRSRRVGQQYGRNRDIDQPARRPGQDRPITNRKKSQSKTRYRAGIDDRLRRETGDRVIAVTTRKFVEIVYGIRPPNRELDGNQQFLF